MNPFSFARLEFYCRFGEEGSWNLLQGKLKLFMLHTGQGTKLPSRPTWIVLCTPPASHHCKGQPNLETVSFFFFLKTPIALPLEKEQLFSSNRKKIRS